MTEPIPAAVLACSLSAAEGAARAARWRALLDKHLLSRTTTTFGERLAFPSESAGELDSLVAAERECCPFLTLTVARSGDTLIVDVSAPPEAAPIVESMFGAGA